MELYQLRQHLEGIAARFAAQHASPAEIAEMQDILKRSENASADLKVLNQINWEFHNALYSAAHNRFLLRSIAAISDEMALLKGTKYIPEDRPASLHREHQRILDAIIARDPDQADCAAQDHIENALRVHLRVGRSQ